MQDLFSFDGHKPTATAEPRRGSEMPDLSDLLKDEQPSASDEHPTSAMFTIHDKDRYALDLKFFSQANAGVWPAKDRHFNLVGDATYNLACEPGEKICFGAYREPQDVEWGAGRNGLRGCEHCCIMCGGNFDGTIGDGGPDKGPPPATFILHNRDRYKLGVIFYSQNRTNHSWPGNGMQYYLAGDNTYRLDCSQGEKICFGAWRDYQTVYWGLGKGNHGCENCCINCGGTFETTLTDAGSDSFPQTNTASVSSGSDRSGSFVGNTIGTATTLIDLGAVVLGSGLLRSSPGPTFHRAPPAQQSTITGH
jgi:hypothetical protein